MDKDYQRLSASIPTHRRRLPGNPRATRVRGTELLLYVGFIVLYIGLDFTSFIHPIQGLNITPWNPAPALGLVLLLRRPVEGRFLLTGTVVLSEWLIRGVPMSWWTSLLSALTLAGAYICLAEGIRRVLPSSTLLNSVESLFKWLASVTLGSLLVSVVYLTSLFFLGLLPAGNWHLGVLQFWIGDGVGIAVAMPLAWWASSERGRALLKGALLRWETLAYSAVGLTCLWFALTMGENNGFKALYLMFVPIVWAAARQGMAGAIISASLIQIEMIATVQLLGFSVVTLAELQVLSLALAVVGFLLGTTIDDQRRTSSELRQTLRLAAASEMAGALAHELNQPLTALAAYASACEFLSKRGESGERLETAIKGVLQEASRAGDVVRRLRDHFRTGATRLEVVQLTAITVEATTYFEDLARKENVRFRVGPLPSALLLVDPLQIAVVLRNLIANAFDAVCAPGIVNRVVELQAELRPGARLTIAVTDSGAGLSGHDATSLFEPFQSAKVGGLGLGLAISRAIIETHGGTLWSEVGDHGVFKLDLPVHSVTYA